MRPTHLLLCILLSGIPFGCSRKESHEDQNTPTLTGEAAPTHGALIAAALTLDARLPRAVLLARTALDRRLTQDEQEELERFLLLGQNERTWAAFGLGAHYKRLDSPPIEPLITAVASWFLDRTPPSAKELQAAAWALGSSGAELAEATLRGWLSPPPDQEAAPLILAGALGLGAFADRRGLLSERTQAALLDAAGREKNGVLLYPLGRLGRLSPAVSSRLLEVSGDLLVHKGAESRRPILFALGSSGSGAAEPLGQVLLSSEYTEGERSAAAQALARLGSEGQQVLDRTTRDLLDRGLPTTETSTLWAPLVSALDGLSDAPQSRKALRQIATVVLPERESTERAALRRRMIWLRCRAADLAAGTASESVALTECDPDDGLFEKLSILRVLDRGALKGKRLKNYLALVRDDDPRVVQAALRLLPSHPEFEDQLEVLVGGLASASAGTQATAAKVIAAYPGRAQAPGEEGGPDLRVTAALGEILKSSAPAETMAAALLAAGALQALTLKPLAEGHCDGPRASLHGPAERALSLLGSPNKECATKKPDHGESESSPSKSSRSRAPGEVFVLKFSSDVGKLSIYLDEPLASQSIDHIVALAAQGFYSNLPVHGVSPGYAVQFGDPDGDGFDSQLGVSLDSELTPSPLEPLSVGMTSFAPGEQGSQIFVSLSGAEELRGKRGRIGRAEGPWHLLFPGDSLGQVSVTSIFPTHNDDP